MKLLTRHHLGLFILCMMASTAHASNNWLDMWRNTDQRAAAHLLQDQFDAAEKLFTRKDWQAVAAYRNKHYAAAEQGFQAQGGAEGFYNQGNARAYQAKYKQAIEAYKQALKLEPKHLDAQHNLAVLEEMLKKNPPESKSESKSDNSNQSDQPNQPEDSEQKQDKGKPNQEKAADNQNGSNNTPSQPDSAPESEQPSDESQEQPAEPEPKPESKSESESEADVKAEAKAKQDEQAESSPQQAKASATDAEQQAKEQWLRLIPDDPGGLLREKFWRDHMKRLQQRHV
ncbi:MAG: tetratricopeptide repeat protein [Legionellaceae bacterium]|nr:tetratricopeptide repeat protein [Legionellaceae bacterium]